MISSISTVEITISCACWAAMSPDGFSTTVLQPASRASGQQEQSAKVLEEGHAGRGTYA